MTDVRCEAAGFPPPPTLLAFEPSRVLLAGPEINSSEMACPQDDVLYVAELLNWRVQKLILKL